MSYGAELASLPKQDDLIEDIRNVAYRKVTLTTTSTIVTMGFANINGTLTERGEQIEEAYFVNGKPEQAEQIFNEAYAALPVPQVILQSLKGRGHVPVSGVLHILIKHGLAQQSNMTECRALLDELNRRKILVYNRKLQTVRVTPQGPGEVKENTQPIVRVIDPDRPYSNLMHLRKMLREAEQFIFWADPHLSKKVLEILAEEQDASRVTEIRLLSGSAQVNSKTLKDFERFQLEASNLRISVLWRVHDTDRDWHDRFIISKGKVWNVPPVNSLLKGDYSEAWLTPEKPPFEKWWSQSVDLDEYLKSK